MSNDESGPLEACALPGTVNVTQAALEAAERFQTAVPAGWIVVFSWYDGGRTRTNKEAPWVDTGPGLDIGAYKVGQIPAAAIWRRGSFRYAVLIRQDIIDKHPHKTIDLDGPRRVIFN